MPASSPIKVFSLPPDAIELPAFAPSLRLFVPAVGVDTEFNIVGNTDMRRVDRKWQHVVACRHQGVLALYLDGALQDEQAPDPQYDFSDPSLTLPCKVGRGQWDNWPSPLPSSAFVGVMQNLRIVKGASVYVDEFDLSLVDREFI